MPWSQRTRQRVGPPPAAVFTFPQTRGRTPRAPRRGPILGCADAPLPSYTRDHAQGVANRADRYGRRGFFAGACRFAWLFGLARLGGCIDRRFGDLRRHRCCGCAVEPWASAHAPSSFASTLTRTLRSPRPVGRSCRLASLLCDTCPKIPRTVGNRDHSSYRVMHELKQLRSRTEVAVCPA
jgi:hypothetical protein